MTISTIWAHGARTAFAGLALLLAAPVAAADPDEDEANVLETYDTALTCAVLLHKQGDTARAEAALADARALAPATGIDSEEKFRASLQETAALYSFSKPQETAQLLYDCQSMISTAPPPPAPRPVAEK